VLAKRLLTAAVAIPLLIGLVSWAPRPLFVAVILVLALLGQWELYHMFARVGVRAEQSAGLILGAMVILAFAAGASPGWPVPLALSLAVVGCLALGLRRGVGPGGEWAGIALTLLGVCYCAWLLGHVIWLRALDAGAPLTYLVLATTWCGETAAYFVGRRWGRRKLAPRISPAKTVEGAAAQVAVSVVAAVVTVRVVGLPGLTPLHVVAVGLVLGVVGQIGDLAESFLKRSADTKDASGLVPGHGGLLDRLDSLLFNVPALYYYVKICVP
jgi:phosphatidate cytidylyltransferase